MSVIYYILLFFLFFPEQCFLVSIFIPKVFNWWIRMVEDSDGDPNHTDGFFIVILWTSIWCFRVSFIMAGVQVEKGIDVEHLLWTFLVVGCALLGVRLSKGSIENMIDKVRRKQQEDEEKETKST